MRFDTINLHRSHGNGLIKKSLISKMGSNIIFEKNVLVFHPENIEIGNNVYIGHYSVLKAYHKNKLVIKDDSWIGQFCFFHSAGGIDIGRAVGIGPYVKILTSSHVERELDYPVISNDLIYKKVIISDGCDIGTGSVILPGIMIGEGSMIGAGSVVTKDVPDYSVYAGNPAKLLRKRE